MAESKRLAQTRVHRFNSIVLVEYGYMGFLNENVVPKLVLSTPLLLCFMKVNSWTCSRQIINTLLTHFYSQQFRQFLGDFLALRRISLSTP